MEEGGVASDGKSFCNAASTACRSSSKKEGSFIVRQAGQENGGGALRFVAFGVERLCREFAISLFQQDLDFALSFFELFLAFARKSHAFFKKLHRFVQRELRTLEFADDFFQTCERTFKFRLFLRFRFLRSWIVHAKLLSFLSIATSWLLLTCCAKIS